MESWAEKYRPRSLDEVVGNPRAIASLRAWAAAWEQGRPDRPGLILAGHAGVGKTSAALALAADMGWGLVELNASDARSAGVIEGVALRGALFQSFADDGALQRRQLILLDEADNLYERAAQSSGRTRDFSDRGGKSAIARTLEQTRQPIILTVNELYQLTRGSGARIKRLTQTVKFLPLPVAMVRSVLRRVAEAEGLELETESLQRLAGRCSGDLRAALNDLQSLSQAVHIGTEETDALGWRDRQSEMLETLKVIFRGDDFDQPRRAVFDLHERPDEVAMWVGDNIPWMYRNPFDRERAYTRLASAATLLGRVQRTQNYGLWGYATELISSGVALAKRNPPAPVNPKFPKWLQLMGASRARRGHRNALAEKLGAATHLSRREVLNDQLPVMRAICRADAKLTARLAGKLELTDHEVAVLLDRPVRSRMVQAVMEASQALRPEREVITLPTRWAFPEKATAMADDAADAPPKRPEPAADDKQKSLFDF